MEAVSAIAERTERRALAELHAGAGDDVRRRLGLTLETVGSALVSVAADDPGILINRTIGLGVDEAATQPALQRIVARYATAGVGRYYLHVQPAARPPELRGWLTEAGLEPGRGWARFVRGAGPSPGARTDLALRRVGPEHGEDFARIVAEGFGMSSGTIPLLAALAGRSPWQVFLAFDGAEPAAAAALLVDGDAAWFDWAATRPEFRRRGCQGALLSRRVEAALEAGCRRMFTETGEAAPGDPQHSYRNILRAGFELLDVRENWVPAVTSGA
jgi:GNAT superfamily N-acetyltransferase